VEQTLIEASDWVRGLRAGDLWESEESRGDIKKKDKVVGAKLEGGPFYWGTSWKGSAKYRYAPSEKLEVKRSKAPSAVVGRNKGN